MKLRLTMNIPQLLSILVATALAAPLSAQMLDYQLRLEPVWSRVADALGEMGSVESAEFSPDGKHIVSGTKFDNSVVMWRTSDGTEIWRQYTEQEVERVGWSADSKLVAAGSEDYLVTVYDAATGDVVKKLPQSRGIDGLTWSNNGNLLVSGEEKIELDDGTTEGYIRVFDRDRNWEEVQTLNFGSTTNELFFSQDDAYLLAVGHGAIKVYRTSDWTEVQTLNPGFYVTFTSGTFSPDAKYVIACGQSDGARGTIYLWDWQEGKLEKTFNHTGKKVESLSWHPNGDYIAHAGHDPYIYVYRVADILNYRNDRIRVASRTWAGDHAEYVDFNADGSFFVSAHQNGLIKLWAWMGEEPDLNERRHREVSATQRDKQGR